jgi:prepilin-type N-terminal cleavage/methylation domain-containing protein
MRMIRDKGFTLLELMVALGVGSILLLGLALLFSQNKRSFLNNEDIARLQEDGRYALEELARDVGAAGFFAELVDPSQVQAIEPSLSGAPDCGVPTAPPVPWIYTLADGGLVSNAMAFVDNATAATAAATFPCIAAGDLEAGNDVMGIKRVAGAPSAAPAAGRVYIRENGTRGILFQDAAGIVPPIPAPVRDWEFTPRVYYVRSYAETPGDGIPTLCRKTLAVGAPPTIQDECIAQGIERVQFEFGIDTDGNGSVNAYVPNPTAAQLSELAAIRIYVLARSVRGDPSYVNPKTYQLSNEPAFTPNDNFYRRVFASTIMVRNVNNLRQLGI